MDFIYNINTSKIVIRMQPATYIMLPKGVFETIEAYYGPLFKALIHYMNNMCIANSDDENSISWCRYLIVGLEFNFMGEDYRIESVDLDKEELNTYSYRSNMVNVFANSQHINLMI